MKRFFAALLFVAALFSVALPVRAEEPKPDDQVVFNLSAENWVVTKTARVSLNVEAAVTAGTSGTMRESMVKAVNAVVKADWRLVSFNRSQDQTGMERWSAQFDARINENELNGLNESAKKNSKAGMQITVANIDFSPTLEETQAALAQVRAQIYKQANDQLTALNGALPGRGYRIAMIDFSGDSPVPMAVYNRSPRAMMAMAKGGVGMDMAESAPSSMERAQKLIVTARVVFAAVPPTGATK